MMNFGFPVRHERGGVIVPEWPLPARSPRGGRALPGGRCAHRADEERRAEVGSGWLPISHSTEGADRAAVRDRLGFCGRAPGG